jgi:hypothetical protein
MAHQHIVSENAPHERDRRRYRVRQDFFSIRVNRDPAAALPTGSHQRKPQDPVARHRYPIQAGVSGRWRNSRQTAASRHMAWCAEAWGWALEEDLWTRCRYIYTGALTWSPGRKAHEDKQCCWIRVPLWQVAICGKHDRLDGVEHDFCWDKISVWLYRFELNQTEPNRIELNISFRPVSPMRVLNLAHDAGGQRYICRD